MSIPTGAPTPPVYLQVPPEWTAEQREGIRQHYLAMAQGAPKGGFVATHPAAQLIRQGAAVIVVDAPEGDT